MTSESVDSLCQRARQAVAQGLHEKARQLYLQALGIRADSPDVHYGLATVCFLVGDLNNAAYHFKEVTRLDPLRAGAYINLGAVYNRLDQVDEAILVLRRGIQLDTHRAEGYYNLGLAYKRKKQLDLAIQAYHEATRLNARMPDAHLNLANAYLDKGQYHQAVLHYRASLEIRPHWEKAENGLAQALAAIRAGTESEERAREAEVALSETALAPQPSAAPTAVLDPEKTIDPNIHSSLLTVLHRGVIESDNHGRTFLQVLEREIEPVVKELSTCLLYPDKSGRELDECVQKFENAVQNIRSAQRSLHSTIEQVRTVGERLIKS